MKKVEFMKTLKYSLRFIPDELYVRIYYRFRVKRKLNLKNPRTFNEKLNWLKFNDRNPFYTIVVDKLANRDYIKRTIGEEYLIPLLGAWDCFDDIDFRRLPNQFVLKCNHDSGGLVICTDKQKLDRDAARKKIEHSLKCKFYYVGREWQYKNITPKVICEQLIGDGKTLPVDYKFMCFNGKPDSVMVCYGRETGNAKFFFFDMEWKLKRYNEWGKNAPENFMLPKPKNFERMIEIAEILSKPYYFARIDLYNINGKIYFGEITLCPNSGFDANLTLETDMLFGKKLCLPVIDFLREDRDKC
ncbi:MAG: ATP-grasp fold amidoligase family protein [Lachnospiraceae bacterium]|nr:ATP-grasp fold amidoligase family protein [Lachnospiraceae bacterium]